jgi:regulator of chromosome condensation
MGEGSAGELGLGATKGACNVNRPRLNKILEEKGILDLAVGGMHCIALTVNNELLTWGVNDNKALGRPLPAWTARDDDEDASDYDDDEGLELNPYESLPTAIPKELFPEGTVFTQVAAGDSATFAVTDEGLVYGWGTFRNSEGIWGFTEDENGKIVKEQNIPLLIKNLKNIKSVSCGDNHALAIDNKGLAFAWGSGQQDQLGRRIVARHAQKNLAPAPVPIPKKAQIAQVIAGPNHNFAIEKDGSVWSWGLNNFAQTGIPYGPKKDNDIVTAPTRVKALKDYKITSIGVGANHSVAVTDEGDLLTFGRLENWALGIKVDSELTNNAELVRKSEHGFPKILLHPTKIDIPAKFTSISCGPDHNIAITTEGKAWGWGFNANLQLGVGRDDDEVKMPELINSKSIQDVKLDWAGCGGQFSMVGSSMHTSE